MAYRSDFPGKSAETVLEDLFKAHGPYENVAQVRAKEILSHEGRVAPLLLDIWDNYGVGDLSDGRLRLCVPFELRAAIDLMFRGDPDFMLEDGRVDVHAVAHTAFGDLFLWSERHWLVYVNIVQGLVEVPFLHRPEAKTHPDVVAHDLMLRAEGPILDRLDRAQTPMFERAKKDFDPLPRMVIYAPGPAITADPFPSYDQLYAAHFAEWLEDRVRSKVWFLSDMATRRFNIREIGAPV